MKSNSLIKQVSKLLIVILLSFLIYYLSIKLLSYYIKPKIGQRIPWNIGLYYGYFVFFITLCVISFSKLFRNKLLHLCISIVAFTGFFFYWKPTYATYPNRTVFILLLGLVICILAYVITRKIKYK